MNDFKVEWDDLAEYELNEIVQYIIAQGAPAAAAKLRKKFSKPPQVYHFRHIGYLKIKGAGFAKLVSEII